MKKIIFLLFALVLINFLYAQQTYQPVYPNYSIQLTKAGSNSPTGELFIYQGSTIPLYEIGKVSNAPTYKHAFYQWNINSTNIPSVAIIDSIVISFDAKFVNYQTSEINYFNCFLDLSDPNLNKNTLWNYSDKNQYTPIGSGLINTPPYIYVEHTHKFVNGSSFVNSFVNSVTQSNRFTLGIAWKYEDTNSSNLSWMIIPLKLNVYFHIPNQLVIIDQRLSDNTQIGKLRKWEGAEVGFTPPPYINPGTPFDFPLLSTQIIQGDQAIYSNEKYNNWNGDKSDVRNHHEFTITPSTTTLVSNFEPTNPGITIKNSLEMCNANGGIIQFKDPWLVDVNDLMFYDPPYGYRNLGMSAPFKQENSPFIPTLASKYKGVFLNQGITPQGQWQPPYYSVKSDAVQDIYLQHTGRTHKFYFQGWSATPQGSAEFQNANNNETGVVFKDANVTVSANLKRSLLSNSANVM